MLGNSPAFMRVAHAARMVATTNAPVLISGERGVGKSLLGREIHRQSPRFRREFVSLRCAGASPGLFAAGGDGPLAEAEGGTLFLDEVSELSAQLQSDLLQFIIAAEQAAGDQPDVRLLASTSIDLQQEVHAGRFREDLFYRLYVVPLEVPPLRERSDDIPLLLKQISQELARMHNRRPPKYSVTSRNLLKRYRWPGNIRELHNFCERMVILMAGQTVQPDDLPLEIRQERGQGTAASHFQLPAEGVDLLAMEGDMIRQALHMSGGNKSKAARLLGLTRDTLLYRIQKHAIQV